MLEIALRARLPLIWVSTDDTMNLHLVLEKIAELSILEIDAANLYEPENEGKLKPKSFEEYLTSYLEDDAVYFVLRPEPDLSWDEIYTIFGNQGRTLVVVNGEFEHPMFNAGQVSLPHSLMVEFLDDLIEEGDVETVASCLGGLTLKVVHEICALAQALTGEITPRSVIEARRMCTSTLAGIEQIDTQLHFYQEDETIRKWVNKNKMFILGDHPSELTPRGLLFSGPSGTGKTMGATYIANQLELPLYRVDIPAMMTKWQGESESSLRRALAAIDHSSPSVVLFDEIEKIFDTGEESGVTTRMLSQLLWWLQEHKTSVLSIMTCNNMEKLPKELYRPGRVDMTVEFKDLPKDTAIEFVKNYADFLCKRCGLDSLKVDGIVTSIKKYHAQKKFTQAILVEWVKDKAKEALLTN